MEVEFLGTGTSFGVPQIGCDCEVCCSVDPRDQRLRTSAIVRVQGKNILIDCGPDFRQQILRASDRKLDALLLTHIHYDHIGGVEDLRPYCLDRYFDIYAQKEVVDGIRDRLPYCFAEQRYPGVPYFQLHPLDYKSFKIGDVEITPLPVLHHKLEIFGYRIGKMAYITDCKYMPDSTLEQLEGIDTLFINALRFREHFSHLSVSEALDLIKKIKPRQSYLIHMGHGIGLHCKTDSELPENVNLAYDTQIIHIED